jgi:hypothetical protein
MPEETKNVPEPPPASDEPSPPVGDELLNSLGEVVNAALGVGAALARSAARLTAGSRPLPEPPAAANPIHLMVHYGTAAVLNVVEAVVAGVNDLGGAARPAAAPAAEPTPAPAGEPPSPPPAGLPTVRQGNTLRIPLSIENPGAEPMSELQFVCLAVESAPGGGTGGPLETTAALPVLRFEPVSLTIAAHDFEKLTVFIEVPPTVQPGAYLVTIGLAQGDYKTSLQFNVLPA